MLKFDLSGKRFNYLLVIERVQAPTNTCSTYWLCRCDCGNTLKVESARLRNGRTKSCGCKRGLIVAAKITKHGAYVGDNNSPTVVTWNAMISRCCRPSSKSYSRYGAAGIIVCKRWRKFENFLSDMGERPTGKTLERINGKLGYSPNNCRWATRQEQQQNIKNNRYVSANGKKMTIRNAATKFGLDYQPFRTALYSHGFAMAGNVRIELTPLA